MSDYILSKEDAKTLIKQSQDLDDFMSIYVEYNKSMSSHFKDMEDPSIYHVSSLSQCIAKRELSAKHKGIASKVAIVPPVFCGSMLHVGIQSVLDYDEEQTKLSIGGKYTLVGSRDYVLKNGTIVDFKFASYLPYKLKPWYSLQTKIYSYMHGYSPIQVWVISPNGFRQFNVKPDKSVDEDFVLDLIENPTYPKWVEQFECSWCNYSAVCPYRSGGVKIG